MTLNEARAEFEALFDDALMGRPCGHIAGHPYVAITSGGIRLEGEDQIGGSTIEEKAIASWLGHMKRYAKLCAGKYLYWRIPPQIEKRRGAFCVYSRLLISPRKFTEQELYLPPPSPRQSDTAAA